MTEETQSLLSTTDSSLGCFDLFNKSENSEKTATSFLYLVPIVLVQAVLAGSGTAFSFETYEGDCHEHKAMYVLTIGSLFTCLLQSTFCGLVFNGWETPRAKLTKGIGIVSLVYTINIVAALAIEGTNC